MGETLSTETTKLEFLGQVYHLKCEDPDVDVREIARYVESKVKEQQELYPGLPHHKLVVMVVMNIGKDYIRAKKRIEALEATVSKKTEELVAKIESAIDFTDR